MIWLTYNHLKLQDGLGSQTQRILSIFLIAHVNGWAYYHTPLWTTSRGVTKDTVDRFNTLITLPTTLPLPPIYETMVMDYLDLNAIKRLSTSKQILIKITFAHLYLDRHSELLEKPFPHHFPWIHKGKMAPFLDVAFHIRRGDVSSTCNQNRYIGLNYYYDCMKALDHVMRSAKIDYQFHIYSEPSLLEETTANPCPYPLNLHLDLDVPETFQALVNADIFFAGFSSLSYSAMMLRATEPPRLTLYTPFWHRFPKRAICVKLPYSLEKNSHLMLNSLR